MLSEETKGLKLEDKFGRPDQKFGLGHLHPISQAILEIQEIFAGMGFHVAEGPELETEFYNFDVLNMPDDHPARDMQDTFWIKNPENFQFPISNFQTNSKSQIPNSKKEAKSERPVLRTHTSGVQVRELEKGELPLRIIVPGKVFRNEATDATHEVQFYQLEGLMVDKEVSLAHLKGVLTHFFEKFLGKDTGIRFRPSFFPFTEPSVEVDVRFRGKWLEMMGAGLVHPNVLTAAGIDAKKWQGFAFGGGLDRLVMVKYGIEDVRLLYSGDLRLVNQF
ncbi:MAG: phenylalanine--tRNA ligase subunit alpha [Candidatus Taylorbacteria bacterium RIFCSPHIGHO2_01_FULL_45_63]|uniref:phenylalanine--tRNA ligase n=1 Tax=Candidatus Taylorbacteria bacterium RIFCSPHIGHO2_02_FULL_45_35 TaxID=1802311 RepID=A0A1G2MQH2_9BACT|nr:MAG: phenylalanine--tRNA ligase subunit alpha [Candidatus Taylorbacteria bacterium RIFCSPHIGHO2_01_FULL_45_63]OHA26115.1 MAG: phenylalanine--tRNA ligase subunit alpha [Candidatus Taylorbacteria bacterium RIFCSPHIGHO2_02_FULL_45_35]OHA32537.1 MAG: phenylalanine--tRNA ligase subunit alpha [Candidatus Taylorbacteria bacterium RIFCSPLOWO2_01_FULL_45_34b]